MTVRQLVFVSAAVAIALVLARPVAAQPPPGVGEGWLGEFDHAARQLTQLAEAIPADKFSWRPAPGVRSVSEVYMHVAIANHVLLGQAGITTGVDVKQLGKEPEKAFTAKADVIKYLTESFAAVRERYAAADKAKPAKLFGKPVTVEGVLLRVLVHNHEHMGQMIAYARMNGVVPPWSKGGGTQ